MDKNRDDQCQLYLVHHTQGLRGAECYHHEEPVEGGPEPLQRARVYHQPGQESGKAPTSNKWMCALAGQWVRKAG